MLTRATEFELIQLDYSKFKGIVFPSVYDGIYSPEVMGVDEPNMESIYRVSSAEGEYYGRTDNFERRRGENEKKSAFYKEMTEPVFNVMYTCLKRNAGRYERRECYDAVERGVKLFNKHFNHKFNELEVHRTDEFEEIVRERELPKGISIDNRGKTVFRKK